MKLTENFTLHEFTCGTKSPTNSVIVNLKMLAIQLQKVRDALNKPLNVVNGLCAYPSGQKAAVRSNSVSAYTIGQKAIELMNSGTMVKGNVIVYDDFVEIDILGKQSFTDNRIIKEGEGAYNPSPEQNNNFKLIVGSVFLAAALGIALYELK